MRVKVDGGNTQVSVCAQWCQRSPGEIVETAVKGGVGSEEEEERAAEAQGREAVWDEGDGAVKGEVLLCRLSEGDVG